MHIKGTPQTMQKRVFYNDLIGDILSSLKNSVEICLETGIKSDSIIIDPGIGFGKTVDNNLEIINRLAEFQSLRYLRHEFLQQPYRLRAMSWIL